MARDAIALCWIGADQGSPALLDPLERGLARELDLDVRLLQFGDRPPDSFDPRRGQHSSTAILRWLTTRVPPVSRKLLALTDVDLFIPVLTFVYGEAVLNGPVAVVSTARLADAAPGMLPSRLLKTCVHELGHTFGLVHCDEARCVMRRSTNVAGVDVKSAGFCRDCRVRFREAAALSENVT